MGFIEETIARIENRMQMERAFLTVLIKDWQAEKTPGMRQYRRDAVKRSIRGIRLDRANLAHWRSKHL